jgi:THO complex subunit 1
LVILRLCNELLRRLSRAEDPVFCGRVYIFLFRSFPLGDKSSVNLRGKFHTENVTTFEDFLKGSLPAEDSMQVDASVSEGAVKDGFSTEDEMHIDASGPGSVVKDILSVTESDSKPTDDEKAAKEQKPTMAVDELYPVFWSLQHLFSNPPRLFEEDKFQEFQRGLEATLAKFKEVPKVIQSGDSAHKTGTQSRPDASYDQFASAFNPKYLTSRDLFKLEVCVMPDILQKSYD